LNIFACEVIGKRQNKVASLGVIIREGVTAELPAAPGQLCLLGATPFIEKTLTVT